MANVTVVKCLVLAGLLLMTFILGVLPVCFMVFTRRRASTLHRRLIYRRILSFLSCYAAGVFLATCVLDLLPSVRSDLVSVMNSLDASTSFPVAEFVMMFGLFLILIIEQIVLTAKERHLAHREASKPLLGREDDDSDDHEHLISSDSARARSEAYTASREHSITGISDEPFGSGSYQASDLYHKDNIACLPDHMDDHHDHSLEPEMEHPHSSLRSVLLILALSLHSIFEGLAVGLQRSTSDVLGIFAALVLHKSILSFSLGMNLIQSKLSLGTTVKSVLLFSLASPIGIGVGIGIMDLWDSKLSSLVQGLLSGIACGTFLYVTFFEVLPHEFNSPDQRLIKVLFLLIGFGTVTGILFLHATKGPICYILPD